MRLVSSLFKKDGIVTTLSYLIEEHKKIDGKRNNEPVPRETCRKFYTEFHNRTTPIQDTLEGISGAYLYVVRLNAMEELCGIRCGAAATKEHEKSQFVYLQNLGTRNPTKVKEKIEKECCAQMTKALEDLMEKYELAKKSR